MQKKRKKVLTRGDSCGNIFEPRVRALSGKRRGRRGARVKSRRRGGGKPQKRQAKGPGETPSEMLGERPNHCTLKIKQRFKLVAQAPWARGERVSARTTRKRSAKATKTLKIQFEFRPGSEDKSLRRTGAENSNSGAIEILNWNTNKPAMARAITL